MDNPEHLNQSHLATHFQKARQNSELIILEGFHALKHALRFGARVFEIYCFDRPATLKLADLLAPDIRARLEDSLLEIDAKTFATLAPRQIETGITALAKRPSFDVKAVMSGARNAPTVLLERPAHLGNLGAVIRTSAGAGAHAVLTTGPLDPWHPAALRGSAGLHFALPTGKTELPDFQETPLIAIDPEGEMLGQTEIPDDAILAFGSERTGLSNALLSRAQKRVAIPMREQVSSLNLAVSVGILLYHMRLRTC